MRADQGRGGHAEGVCVQCCPFLALSYEMTSPQSPAAESLSQIPAQTRGTPHTTGKKETCQLWSFRANIRNFPDETGTEKGLRGLRRSHSCAPNATRRIVNNRFGKSVRVREGVSHAHGRSTPLPSHDSTGTQCQQSQTLPREDGPTRSPLWKEEQRTGRGRDRVILTFCVLIGGWITGLSKLSKHTLKSCAFI